MTLPLKDVPADVNDIVRKEQIRLEVEDGMKLKKECVYYNIVREWKKLRMNNKCDSPKLIGSGLICECCNGTKLGTDNKLCETCEGKGFIKLS